MFYLVLVRTIAGPRNGREPLHPRLPSTVDCKVPSVWFVVGPLLRLRLVPEEVRKPERDDVIPEFANTSA